MKACGATRGGPGVSDMDSKILHACGLMLVTVAGLTQVGCEKAAARAEPPPPKVSVAKPETREVVDFDEYNGWLKSLETVDIRSRVRGHLDKVHFKDGDLVTKGQLLFELDPRPIQAEVDREKDQVKVYQAQAVAAAKEEARLKELVKKGGASQSQVDAAEAQSQSFEAQIQATEQEVKRKALDLEYSRITAPIAGRIGRAMITTGNLVNAGGTDPVLATIMSVDPIAVYFDVDERSLQRYAKSRGETSARPASARDVNLSFTFGLETDTELPHSGKIDFANNQVDSATGTIQVRGVVENPASQFVPGSRVRIRLPISEPHQVLLVPDTAILTDLDRRYVLSVDDKNIVKRRDIEPGKLLDDGSRVVRAGAAAGGLTADDWIITQGIQTARINYAVEPVRPSSTTQATASAAGAPATGAPAAVAPATGAPATGAAATAVPAAAH
jgi:RND family efflux transporter MFP subunit